jgi:hypothetical protein
MPGVIDVETVHIDDLPTIWCPIQQELSPEEHAKELQAQATASLLWATPIPEQILRILLDETAIDRIFDPPDGYDPDAQGEWNPGLLTFAFKRAIKLMKEERTPQKLLLEYKIDDAGYWAVEITEDTMTVGHPAAAGDPRRSATRRALRFAMTRRPRRPACRGLFPRSGLDLQGGTLRMLGSRISGGRNRRH